MTKDEALKMALDALQKSFPPDGSKYEVELEQKHREAITAIKQALEQPEQEPVATVLDWVNGSNWRNYTIDWHSHVPKGAKLYTHPPAPELKPLSLDEIHQRYKNLRGNEPPHYIDIYRDAEAALGILRGGL